MPLNSAQYVHLLAEIEKRVFADRADYLGDPDFSPGPGGRAARARLPRAARRGGEPRAPHADRRGASPAWSAHHNTTHFSIVDGDGNAVANTYTLNDDFGSGEVVRGAGFLLNNEMDDFSSKPGAPTSSAWSAGDANAIAPGKRPLSTMTPTILVRDGRVALVHRHSRRLAHRHLDLPGAHRLA